MTIEEFNEGFGMLLDYYPNTKVTEGLVNVYFLGLSELSVEQFNHAIAKIVKEHTGEFLPKIPVILKYAKNTDIENQVFLAKKMLKAGITRRGRTGMINFEDKGVHAVIDFIGWIRLLNMNETEFESFLNFQFDGIYKNFIESPYETSEYFTGTSQIFGQTTPAMITYSSIGINSQNLKFIPLNYKSIDNLKKIDMSELKGKMLIGD